MMETHSWATIKVRLRLGGFSTTLNSFADVIKIMRTFVVLLVLLLFAVGIASNAGADCSVPQKIAVCEHIKYCSQKNLTPKNTDLARLLNAIKREDGHAIKDATGSCQKNVGNRGDWDTHVAGCGVDDIRLIVISAKQNGWDCGKALNTPAPQHVDKYYCYTQGKYYELDQLGPPGTGICRGPKNDDAACTCGSSSPGTVKKF